MPPVSSMNDRSRAASSPETLGAVFVLGTPRLDDRGLDLGWLLDQTARRHRRSLAERRPLVARAPVIACTTLGRPDLFGGDDRVTLRQIRAPTEANRWTSENAAVSLKGATLRIELTTAAIGQVRPADPSFLRGRSVAVALLEQKRALPSASLPIRSHHLDGVGLADLSTLLALIRQAEREVLPREATGYAVIRSETLRLDDIAAGDTLDVFCETRLGRIAGIPRCWVETIARRRSDGAVVAAATSSRAPPHR